MKRSILLIPIVFLLLLGLLLWHPWRSDSESVTPPPSSPSGSGPEIVSTPPTYQQETPSPGGIGKIYMGREIARVMGHQAIGWLERDNRESEESPSRAVSALNLAPDERIADIGAGSGYYTFLLAPLVPDGQVIAVDIQVEMIDYLESREKELGFDNITAHLGGIQDARLEPDSIDSALMVDAYHEFSHPREMMDSIVLALRPGGRVFLMEYRAEDPSVPIKTLHKMTQVQAKKEMKAVGLEWETTHDLLPWQHLMVFRKPGG